MDPDKKHVLIAGIAAVCFIVAVGCLSTNWRMSREMEHAVQMIAIENGIKIEQRGGVLQKTAFELRGYADRPDSVDTWPYSPGGRR